MWRHGKFGTPYILKITHAGAMSQCKLICKDIDCVKHQVETKKLTCASVKCNSVTNKCLVQYRLLHCKSRDIWWVRQLEEWWKGPDGTSEPAIHLNTNPTGIDNNPTMHSGYKNLLNTMYSEDPRAPKTLVHILATNPIKE